MSAFRPSFFGGFLGGHPAALHCAVMNGTDSRIQTLRRDLLACYRAGLQAVAGRERVRQVLNADDAAVARVYVVALGKAAAAMTRGALDAWDHRIEGVLLITKTGHADPALIADPRVRCIESAHPVPDARSLQAGEALLKFLAQTPGDAHLLFLISGGASSLVEVLAPGLGLEDLARTNQWLLGSGLDIASMNAVRQGLSAIKGGRLCAHLGGRPTRALLISDVQGDDPGVIGSGLLVPGDPGSWRRLNLPPWLTGLLQRSAEAGSAMAENVQLEIIANLDRALAAAAAHGRRLGYAVSVSDDFVQGDACVAGEALAAVLTGAAPGLYLWGGETTVRLPPQPGRGGRCQALALCAARRLVDRQGVALLAAGTDGSDGPGEDAGALVDAQTLWRGADMGLDAERCLVQADAGRFLEAAGDLVQTGPTGTNVMDLMIGGRVT